MRTAVVRCDARHAQKHSHGHYTFTLQRPLANVTDVSLLGVSHWRSPLFTLVRISDWETSGTALGSTDNFHQMAVRMQATIAADPTYVAVITNPAGTVSLQVHDVHTMQRARGDGDFKTYDVLVCTGTITALTFTDWTITAEKTLGQDETPATALTPTGDAATLLVRRDIQPAVIHVRLNGQMLGRVQDPQDMPDEWCAYSLYYAHRVVTHSGTRYMCTTKHISNVFTTDVLSGYWSALTANAVLVPATHDAFVVLDDPTTNQSAYTERFMPGQIAMSNLHIKHLRHIEVEWLAADGRPYVFPYDVGTRITSMESATAYTQERLLQRPSLELAITHAASP